MPDTAGYRQVYEEADRNVIINPYRYAGGASDYTTNMILQVLEDTGFSGGTWTDQSGAGNDLTYGTGFTHNGTENAVEGDGSADATLSLGSWGEADFTMFAAMKTSDAAFMLTQGDASTEFAGVAQDTSSDPSYLNAGTPVYYTDDVLVSPNKRDDLHTSWSTNTYLVATMTDVDGSGWTSLRLFDYSGGGFDFTGFIKEIRIYDTDLTAGQRATVVSAMQTTHGI